MPALRLVRFTLTYSMPTGPITKENLRPTAVERIGELAVRAADRGDAWDIAVYDAAGDDVTFNFACFT